MNGGTDAATCASGARTGGDANGRVPASAAAQQEAPPVLAMVQYCLDIESEQGVALTRSDGRGAAALGTMRNTCAASWSPNGTTLAVSSYRSSADPTFAVDLLDVRTGQQSSGWAYGLAAAGIGADAGAPLLLLGETIPPATTALVSNCNTPAVDLVVVGPRGVVDPAVVAAVDAPDGGPCGRR